MSPIAKADFDKAKTSFPSTAMDEEQWVGVFDRNPDVMWAIIADVFNAVKDEEERASGVRRMGRRPMRVAGSMDEVYRTVFPAQFQNEPFPAAFKQLLGDRSQRQFARRVPCNQSLISRLLSGEIKPDLAMLQAIAAAAKVPPYFFVEYRAEFIGAQIARILTEQPHLGIQAMKRYRAGQ